MKKLLLLLTLLCVSTAVSAQDADRPTTYDPDATAESLGLEPYVAPDGFFPLFPWDFLDVWGDQYHPMEEGIKSMAECEFTLSGFVGDARGVKIAGENGLKCICRLPFKSFDQRELSEEEIQKKCAEIDATVKENVESTKDDPTVVGYYIIDEPGAYCNRSLAAAVEAVKKYAPGKLAYINLYPGYASTIGADVDSQLGTFSYREYLERYVQEVKPQFLSYDNYMIQYSEDMRTMGRGIVHFTDLFEVRAVAQKYNLPFWFIGTCLCLREPSSPPTAERYAYQMYTALAAGAEGLTWFLYYPRYPHAWQDAPIDENGNKTLSWTYLRDVNEQMKSLGTYLQGYRSTECGLTPFYTKEERPELPQTPELPQNVLKNVNLAFSKNTDNYEAEPKLMIGEFAQKDGDAVAALAVNLDRGASVKVTFDLPEGYKTLKIVSPIDGSESVVPEDAVKDGFWIIPGHGKLFVLEK
ncbi:MAG: hypothetical protein IJM54_08595 [Thermoguttaceae bacterium]|nr:hypothetical protein [Thermoguttaceae bacterium]